MSHRSKVMPYTIPITELECREALATPLLRLCSAYGPTKVAGTVSCKSDRTIRDARDEKATLRIDYIANLLLLDPTSLDGILAHFGRRSVPISSVCNTDDRVAQSSVLKAALALSIALEDDDQIDADEVRQNRATIEAAVDALNGLLGKLAPQAVRA